MQVGKSGAHGNNLHIHRGHVSFHKDKFGEEEFKNVSSAFIPNEVQLINDDCTKSAHLIGLDEVVDKLIRLLNSAEHDVGRFCSR